MSITYNEPLTPPIINSVAAIPGDFPAGTYYIWVLDRGNEGRWHQSPMFCSSMVKTVFELTEPGGISVDITPTDSRRTYSNVWIGTNTQSDMFFYRFDNSMVGTTETTLNIDTYIHRYQFFVTIEKALTYPNFINSITSGIGMIEVTGNAGTFTVEDIASVLNTAGADNYWFDGERKLYMLHSIDLRDATGGTFDVSNTDLWLFGGLFNTDNRVLLYSSSIIGRGTKLSIPTDTAASDYFFPGQCNLNNAEISGDYLGWTGHRVWGGRVRFSSQSRLTNCSMYGGAYSYPANNPDCFVDCNFYLSWTLAFVNINEPTNEIKGLNFLYDPSQIRTRNNYSFILRDAKSSGVFNLDHRRYSATPSGIRLFIDCDFNGELPNIYWRHSTDDLGEILYGNSINIKIINEDGDPVENVNVKINNNEEELLNTTTGVDGKIDEFIGVHKVFTQDTGLGEGYNTITTDKNPFGIKISKTGYETYETEIEIEDKQDLIITLKKAVPLLIDSKGEAHLRFNKENIGNNRDLIS